MKPSTLFFVFLLAAPISAPLAASPSYSQSATAAAANPNDAKNCSDPAAVPRVPGSTLTRCASTPGGSLQIPSGKDASGLPIQKSVTGNTEEREYKAPNGMTADQLFSTVRTILKDAGFTVVFEDSPKTLSANKQSMWCIVQSSGNSFTETIVNSRQTQPATQNGSLMADVLDRGERLPIHGIHFDDRGAIAANSDDSLGQIAALLVRDPALKIRVEAYAYNGSDAADNLFLSQKEAQAIVDWLGAHGIDKSRLSAQGMGASAPIAEAENGGSPAAHYEIDLVKVQ